jgi:hypothetical protein
MLSLPLTEEKISCKKVHKRVFRSLSTVFRRIDWDGAAPGYIAFLKIKQSEYPGSGWGSGIRSKKPERIGIGTGDQLAGALERFRMTNATVLVGWGAGIGKRY